MADASNSIKVRAKVFWAAITANPCTQRLPAPFSTASFATQMLSGISKSAGGLPAFGRQQMQSCATAEAQP